MQQANHDAVAATPAATPAADDRTDGTSTTGTTASGTSAEGNADRATDTTASGTSPDAGPDHASPDRTGADRTSSTGSTSGVPAADGGGASRRARAQVKVAAILILAQGVLMEASVFIGFFVLRALAVPEDAWAERFTFAVPYFQENLAQMMLISGVFGALRIIAAVGLLRNRLWGFALAVIMCTVTCVLMIFMLPAGIADGVLSGGALVLLLMARYGRRTLL